MTKVPKSFNREGIIFSTNNSESIGYPYAKEKSYCCFILYTKIKRDQRLTCKNYIKFLDENIGENLHDLGVGKDFFLDSM